jgi:hypothetical protein
MLSDTDAACVANVIAKCLNKKKKIHHWTKNGRNNSYLLTYSMEQSPS